MAAQLANCRKCGKLFLRVKEICVDCYNKQEEDYSKVVDHLREFPGSNIQELSDATEVSVGQIREFILADRLLSGNYTNLSYSCESCGKAIQTGKLCLNCMTTINQLAKKMERDVTNQGIENKGKSGGYISRNL